MMNKKTKFGMLSVKAGIDNNPNPTQADRIAGATKKMSYGGKAKKKGYAYGSMVRSPMTSENKMKMSANPMEPRQQQGGMQGMQPAMGMPKMRYGGKS
jgi:hypothetical protein